jgi:hypothetical protein
MSDPSDREQIYDLMVKYGRANDTHDADLARTLFTSDVTARYEPYSDELVGFEAFMERWIVGLERIQTTHQFTNFTFDIKGDGGSFSCLLIAQHWPRDMQPFGDAPMYMNGASYHCTVRRTADGWRICRLHLRTLWASGDPQVLAHLVP